MLVMFSLDLGQCAHCALAMISFANIDTCAMFSSMYLLRNTSHIKGNLQKAALGSKLDLGQYGPMKILITN